jgi:hypothetical protein
VEQVTLNRRVQVIERAKAKKPALNSAGFLNLACGLAHV